MEVLVYGASTPSYTRILHTWLLPVGNLCGFSQRHPVAMTRMIIFFKKKIGYSVAGVDWARRARICFVAKHSDAQETLGPCPAR